MLIWLHLKLQLSLSFCSTTRLLWEKNRGCLGNCDIRAEQKVMFTNEKKLNEIQSRPKGWVQKIFWTLPPNFGKSHNQSGQKFSPFCMAWVKVSEMRGIFNKFFKSVWPNLVKIFHPFYRIKWKITKNYEI